MVILNLQSQRLKIEGQLERSSGEVNTGKRNLFIVFPLDWTGEGWWWGSGVGAASQEAPVFQALGAVRGDDGTRVVSSATGNQCFCREQGLGMGFVVKTSYPSPRNSLYDTGSARKRWKLMLETQLFQNFRFFH